MKVKLVLAALALAAGLGAAAVLPRSASAWDVYNLPSPCSLSQHIYDSSTGNYSFRVNCAGNYQTFLYGTSDYPNPPTNPNFQSDLDAFVNTYYVAPTTTTTDTTTTTGGTTTTSTTTVTQTVTVPGATPPASSFTYAPSGLAVTFTDASTAGSSAITKVTWLFGDGANDTGSSVSHTYTASGTFNVVELVTDANGLIDRSTQTISVSPFNGHPAFAEATNAKLASAATATFGQPLAVYCVTSWGGVKPENGYGLTIVGSHQANIWQAGCTALATKRGPVALALLVLGHESAHALGITSEKTSDCYSLRKLPMLEKQLGITDKGYRATEASYVHKKWGRC